MNAIASPTSSQACPFCDKHGLPILPARYAIARANKGNAPKLSATFGTGVTSIDLPARSAHYTLRLLRSGYLYAFDERRNEWSGYVVNPQGYLYAFDIHAKVSPEVGNKEFNDACRAKNDPYLARCITVKDAAHATRVWLGFSDVMWTAAVLQKHASADYRKAHMQCIDVAAWRGGGTQPHVGAFDALKQVAEFAADGASLQKETRSYVQNFMPSPYTKMEDLLKTDPASKMALGMLSPMIKKLWAGAVGKPAASGPVDAAAWAFSTQRFWLAHDEVEGLMSWANSAAKPWRPAVVGLFDPAGIAIELNGLALQCSIEFTDDKQRRWIFETASTIDALRNNVMNGAVKSEKADRQLSKEIGSAAVYAKGGYYAAGYDSYDAYKKNIAKAGELTEAEESTVAQHGWKKYSKEFDEPGERKYVETTYPSELQDFTDAILAPLDVPYLAWLKSNSLSTYLTHNYDSQDCDCGAAYTDLVTAIIHNASGRTAVLDYLSESLQQDPHHPEAWLMRGLALNHDPLITGWKEKALEQATSKDFPWKELVEKFHDKFKDVIVQGAGQHLKRPYGDVIARFAYQLSGAAIKNLSKAIDQGVAAGGSKLPTNWLMGILGAMAREENPNLIVVDLRGEWSRKNAARTLAGMLAKYAGDDPQKYRSGARSALDSLAKSESDIHPYHGVMLIDKAKAQELAGLTGPARKAAVAGVLTPAEFDAIMQESAGKLGNMDFKSGVAQLVFSSITLYSAFKDMMKAKPGEVLGKSVNFAAGAVGLVGTLGQAVGAAAEKTAWGATRTARQWKFMAIEMDTRASWLVGVGKLMGVAGGIVAGVLEIIDGYKMTGNHLVLGWLHMALGFGSILAAILMLFAATAGLGFVLMLVIGAIMVVISWITPDALQDWLGKSLSFGKGGRFDGPVAQAMALKALATGG
ncbi:T6SS effector BTH_I2691 family protein [Paraburkholderia bannensis]|uniref:T6SS effector BTH_I2691 family protein n=1 Tax=Paraburkholderia bannensis TaxID=765414 RepID=UPI002AB79515|nr:T6SS effector BTH_I2691 family protein [Paraburkholderia bannensis]